MRIGRFDLVEIGKELIYEIKDDDVPGMAAELAYRFFLALFPFFILLASLGGLVTALINVGNPAERFLELTRTVMPDQAAGLIAPQLRFLLEHQSPGLLSFGLVGTLVAATGGMNAIIKAMNRAYDVEETRPFWKRYLMAMGLTVLAGVITVVAFAIFLVGQAFGAQIAEAVGLGAQVPLFISIARWVLVFGMMLGATLYVYWRAPNIHVPLKWMTVGAVVYGLGWVLATYAFSLYVQHFGSYSNMYGTLGGVVVLLLWFYVIAFVLLIGAELNAIIDERVDPQQVEQQRQQKRQEKEQQEARRQKEPRQKKQRDMRRAA